MYAIHICYIDGISFVSHFFPNRIKNQDKNKITANIFLLKKKRKMDGSLSLYIVTPNQVIVNANKNVELIL